MNNKYKIQSVAALFAMTVLTVGCTDKWDDHYTTGSLEGTGDGTLWEAIASRADLSNFTRVVKECGYDVTLGGSQSFTVFAPTNDYLTDHQADSLIEEYEKQVQANTRKTDNTVVKQFLQNHIALYKYPVSSLTNDTVTMMNGKYQPLTPSSIGGGTFRTSNTLCENGVLFTIDRPISYFPNIFEYLGQDEELDSVSAFLNKYNEYVFQPDKSVPGDIVDGQTVYLDSVVVLENPLLSSLGYIASEDSTYWMLAPTNNEWEKYISEYESYFNYGNTVVRRDSLQYINARIALIGGSVFNRTDNPDEAFRDSAVSTQAPSSLVRTLLDYDEHYYIYYKPFDADGIFGGSKDIMCSNGHVLKTSQYKISKYDTFLQTLRTEAEAISASDTIINAEEPLTIVEVAENNPFYNKVSGHSYVDVVPETPDVNPIATFRVPGVFSNVGYDIYVVFAPGLAADTLASAEKRLPNSFRATIGYYDQNGKAQSKRITTRFYTTPDVVDSVLVSSNFVFPVCTAGVTENQVTIQLQSVVSSKETSQYSRTMHIDCILFVPHDKDAETIVRRIKK